MRFMPRRTSHFRHSTAVTADLHNSSCIFQSPSRLYILGLVLDLTVQVVQKDKKIVRDRSDNHETHTLRPNWTSGDLAVLGTQPH